MKKIIIAILCVILLSVAYYLISPLWRVVELDEQLPLAISTEQGSVSRQPELKASSLFEARAHEVQGSALILEQSGERTLRFENFETVNGPNLHIYLAADENAQDFVNLGPIKATKGNVNYNLPSGVDLRKYNQVIVFCVPFKVVFSIADLSSPIN